MTSRRISSSLRRRGEHPSTTRHGMASTKRDGDQRPNGQRLGRELRSPQQCGRRVVPLRQAGRMAHSEHIGVRWGQAEQRHSPIFSDRVLRTLYLQGESARKPKPFRPWNADEWGTGRATRQERV